MNKEPKRQANFRLPEQLLEDLRLVSDTGGDSQSEIVRKAVEQKVERLKTKHKLSDSAEVAK